MTVYAVRLKPTHPQGAAARYRRGGLIFTTGSETLVDSDEVEVAALQSVLEDELLTVRETDLEAQPPEEVTTGNGPFEPLFCIVEDCPASGGDFVGFASEASLGEHAREAHGMEAIKLLESGDVVFQEDGTNAEPEPPVDLSKLNREDLDVVAIRHGLDPKDYSRKELEQEAIEAHPLPSFDELLDEVVRLRGEVATLTTTAAKTEEGKAGA